MRHIFYKRLFLLLVLVGLGQLSLAQETVTKKTDKTILFSNEGALYIDNKYGDIIINGWERDSISIVLDIKVSHKKLDQAQSLIDRIEPSIKMIGNATYITSEIIKKNGNMVSKYFNKANPLGFDKSNVQIDYTIYLPSKASVDITNKFGDVIIDDYQGKLKVNLEHGDMWLNNDLSNVSVDIKYGKMKAKAISYANITAKNGGVDLKSSNNLSLNSSGSTIELGAIDILDLTSNKDEIEIVSVNDIRGEYKFSTIHIGNVKDAIDVKMKVTDFEVAKITTPEAFVYTDQESSDITINITGLAFKFRAYLKEGVLRIPKTFENIKSEMIDKSEKLREINATYGKNPLGKISITGKKGTILFRDSVLGKSN